ncbi:PC-esterase domain-containing protein 1B [Tupaia chinensis]|uniref:Protein FAM113B n=1 Tax=Tupaia chinensis TaxID=246437 RepID=L9LCR3_TUPCH|nr:PC-esterase domain-containing protein 1B [Tupaia chinensis]ELW72713.1 Protein FAM113B [Tupaia chinensis]
MAHLRACEVRQLLHNKFVVVMGDSVQRAVYKDLVLLLQKDCLLSSRQLKAKGELSFERDVLLDGGGWGRMHNGTHYREVRQFCTGHHLVRFYFLTRVYSPYVQGVLEELRTAQHAPDLVVLNSCLWDLSRYGHDFRRSYPEDLESLFRRLNQALPESCLLVWNTAMPVAETVFGGFLPPEPHPRAARLREDVMEANFYSSTEADRHGFDVLDLHFHFRHAGEHRQRDGVHWDERAHRHLSQLLLAHVADAWGVDLPGRATVGRWIRDGPAAGRMQPSNSRGDPEEEALSLLPRPPQCSGASRRPSVPFFQAQPLRPGTGLRSSLPLQHQQESGDSSMRQIGYTREANSMVSLQSRLGPIRTASSWHRGQGSPPYPPQHRSSGLRRGQRRRSNRRIRANQETRPQ